MIQGVIGTNSDIQTATANVAGAVNIVLNDITGEQVDCIVGDCYATRAGLAQR